MFKFVFQQVGYIIRRCLIYLAIKKYGASWMNKQKSSLLGNQPWEAIQYSERVADTRLWIGKADELIIAANFLEPEVLKYWSEFKGENSQTMVVPKRKCLQEAYLLLIAYALENFLKALLVHQNQKTLKGFLHLNLPKYLHNHDLIKLASQAGFKIALPEEELFSRLSRFSMWAARYPLPTRHTGLANVTILSDGKPYLNAYYKPQDIDQIHSITDRLRKYVVTEIANPGTLY
jgi:hypothetical protein